MPKMLFQYISPRMIRPYPTVTFNTISPTISAAHAINGVAFRFHDNATSMTIIETNFVLVTEPNHMIISGGGVSSSLVICGV